MLRTEDLALALELTLLDCVDLEGKRTGPGTALSHEGALLQRLTDQRERRCATAYIATRWIGERLHAQGGHTLMQKTLREVAEHYCIRSTRMVEIATDAWSDIA
jgi:hypothetical protein